MIKSSQKYDDEQAILNILDGKAVTTAVDKAYIKTMHQQLQSTAFKDWSIQAVLPSKERLAVY